MIIGTMHAEEAKVFDSQAGYHSFHTEETQEPYGSFEVFWHDSQESEDFPSGWYWQVCFPGCLPDGEPSGPFARSSLAHEDADEWAPEYDD